MNLSDITRSLSVIFLYYRTNANEPEGEGRDDWIGRPVNVLQVDFKDGGGVIAVIVIASRQLSEHNQTQTRSHLHS